MKMVIFLRIIFWRHVYYSIKFKKIIFPTAIVCKICIPDQHFSDYNLQTVEEEEERDAEVQWWDRTWEAGRQQAKIDQKESQEGTSQSRRIVRLSYTG